MGSVLVLNNTASFFAQPFLDYIVNLKALFLKGLVLMSVCYK